MPVTRIGVVADTHCPEFMDRLHHTIEATGAIHATTITKGGQ